LVDPDEPGFVPENETRNDDDDDDNDNNDDCDDERFHEARLKLEEKVMPLGSDPYGVNGLGEGDCEFIVIVATEEDAKNFPMSSIDGFPIRVEVGIICLIGAGGQQQQHEQEQSRDPSCPPPLRFPVPGPGNDTDGGGNPPSPPIPSPPPNSSTDRLNHECKDSRKEGYFLTLLLLAMQCNK
jgi:hypothetical protein